MSEIAETPATARTLVLLRHGESSANAADAFGGWLDFPLTEQGQHQASAAGRLICRAGLRLDVVHTSILARAVDTGAIVIAASGTPRVTAHSHWRLNERHYGALQGRSREAVRAEFGAEMFAEWRRSYEVAPPPLSPENPDHPRHDPRYATLPPRELPSSESLADVRRRLVPYWQDAIAGDLLAGKTTLVVAHGNSLRALCMHLDDLTPDEVRSLSIPCGAPLRYDLDDTLVPLVRGGRYLDPEAAPAGLENSAGQASS